MSSINFNSLDFSGNGSTDRQLVDHLFMLKEQLEYTLSNLDSTNFNYKFFDELTVRVQDGLNIQGVVTFEDLANNSQTVINGAYIKTGVMEASQFKTYTYAEDTQTYGELLFYYQEYLDNTPDMAYLAGGMRMDDEGLGTDNSSRFRLWVYTKDIPDSAFKVSLKLSSAYKASLEAVRQIYIHCADEGGYAGIVTIDASVINLNGVVRVNGTVIS